MSTTTTPRLSPSAERRLRRTSTGFVIFVALAAAILSFSGLHALALSAGFHPWIAPLFPLATDVAVAAFSLAILHHSLTGLKVWYPWACMILGVGVSVAGNVWAAPDDTVSRLVHAWPPIVFALSFEALTRLVRHRIDHGADISASLTALVPPALLPALVPTDVPAARTPFLPSDLASSWASAVTAARVGSAVAAPAAAAPAVADVAAAPRVVELAPDVAPVVERVATQPPAPRPAAPEFAPETVVPKPVVPAASASAPIPDPQLIVAAVPAVAAQDSPAAAPRAGTVREKLIALIVANPAITQAEASRTLGADPSNISKHFKYLHTNQPDLFDVTPDETPASVPVLEPVVAPAVEQVASQPAPAKTDDVSILVGEAKNRLVAAAGGDKALAARVWSRLEFPNDQRMTIGHSELDDAIAALTGETNGR